MKRSEEDAFREFVAPRMHRLRRTAYLLCRDWHVADDLVAVTLDKLFRHWGRARQAANMDAYVQTMLTRAWLDERRRPWRRETAVEDIPELVVGEAHRITDRMVLLDLLAELTPRRRAAVVLRFYCDLSVEEAAEALGCSAGTVKSLTARALDGLRSSLAVAPTLNGVDG